jgi:hypothetical protein
VSVALRLQIQFTVDPIDPVSVEADPQLLTSAVMKLLHNAFKNTPSGGRVVLRARAESSACSSRLKTSAAASGEQGQLFQVFGDRRGSDRSGLGLGLSIARKAVRAHGGEIVIRNLPGKGVRVRDRCAAVSGRDPRRANGRLAAACGVAALIRWMGEVYRPKETQLNREVAIKGAAKTNPAHHAMLWRSVTVAPCDHFE